MKLINRTALPLVFTPKFTDPFSCFNHQDFYVVYDQDAEFVADEFYHSRTVLKTLDVGKKTTANKGNKAVGPSYINLSQTLAETVVKTLINEKMMKVEIYTAGDDKSWFLYRKGSPGNVQQLEELLFARTDVQESPIMMALTYSSGSSGQRIVGASFCDALMKKLYVCEFLDSENFSNLESLIVQVGAKECCVPPLDLKDKDAAKILEILERCQIVVEKKKKSDFDGTSLLSFTAPNAILAVTDYRNANIYLIFSFNLCYYFIKFLLLTLASQID